MAEFLLLKRGRFLNLALALFSCFFLVTTGWGQTVMTDLDDYYPGDVLIISGYQWEPGETVELHIREEAPNSNEYLLYAEADSNGNIYNDEFIFNWFHLGVSFSLRATGLNSGATDVTYFTDAPRVGSVTIFPSLREVCKPTGTNMTSVTYIVDPARGSGQNSNGNTTVGFCVSELPTGVTASFNPTTVSSNGQNDFGATTLTLTITSSATVGRIDFTVKAYSTSSGDCSIATDFATTSGSLTVKGGPNFTSCPSNITSNVESGTCTKQITYTALVSGTSETTYTLAGATTSSGSGTGSGSIFNRGTTNVTITTSDGCGSTTCSFTVTVTDDEAPTLTAVEGQTEEVDANCEFTIPDYTSLTTGSDNCGTATVTQSPAVGTVISGDGTVQTITLTADDGNGNTSSITFGVTLEDSIDPVLTAASNQDVVLGENCSIIVPDVTGSATDNCAGTTITQLPAAGTEVTAIDGQTINVVVTAEDAAGNKDEATVVLTAQDETAPVLTAASNQDVVLGENCSIIVPDVTGSATDNCAGTTITQLPAAGTEVTAIDGQTINVVVTAEDAAGNKDEATVVLTAQDETAPVLTAASNQDVVLGENCSIIVPDVTGSATDNCAGTTITQLPAAGTEVTAIDGQTINVVVTAEDAAGNKDEATVLLTAQDETAPVLTAASNQDVVLGENCSIIVPDVTGSATDNCAGTTITQLPAAGTVVTAIDGQTINVVVTAEDAAGNKDEATVVLTAQDETAPVLTAASNQDVFLGENCSIIVPDVTGSATDNCAGTTITQLPAAGTVVTAIDGQTINVVVTAEDAAGNTDEATVVLTAQDETAPVLTAASNQDVFLGENCSIIVPDVTGSATDNCAGTTITQLPAAGTEVTAIDGQTINVVVTAEDAAGNTDEATVVLTAQDETAPVLTAASNQDVVLGENCSIIVPDVTGSATDNCEGTTITQLPAAGTVVTAIDGQTINVVVTAEDAAGNTDEATVVLTAQDETAPVLTAASNQDVFLGENCSIIVPDVTGSATDNCAGTTITQLPAAGTEVTAIDGQTINVVVTAEDAAGNTDEATVLLTAQDETAPVLTAASNQDVVLGENCSIIVPDVTGSATDNCEGTTITQLPAAGTEVTAIDGQEIEVVVTAEDAAGNTDEATVVLTAQDETAPVLTAASNQDVVLGENCYIIVPDVTGSATDNCAGTTITQLPAAGTEVTAIDGQTINVVVTAEDAAGNTDEATVVLTAQDETAPVLTAASNQDVVLGENCSIIVPDVTGSATDNCEGTTITQLPAAGTEVTAVDGQEIEVVVTAEDAAGNTDEATVVLTAQDETAPVLTAASNQDVVLGENCSIIVPDVTGSATDNCAGTTITQLPAAGTEVTAIDGQEIEVVVTAEDAAGNTDEATVVLTAQDETVPVLTAASNQDVVLGENCSIIVPDVTGSATDNCAGTTITQLPAAGTEVTAIDGQTINVVVTAEDAAGNTDEATVVLTAQDETAPVLTAASNQDVVLGENCSIIVPDVTGSATDNCEGTTITQLPAAGTEVTAVDGQEIEVVVTAEDAAGNTDEATVVLTAQDETAPVLTAASNQDVVLGENCSIIVPDVTGSATDNCAGTTITQLPAAGTEVTAIDGQEIEVVVTAEDAAGNTDEATVVLTAQDETVPVLTAASNQDVVLGENCSIIVPDVTGSATDNCAGTTITQLPAAGTEVTAIDGQEIEVVVTAEDAAGNTDEATVVLTAQDETVPVLTAASNQDVVLGENCSIIVPDVTGSATDNCAGTTITQLPAAGTVVTAIDGQTINVVVTAEDAAGNKDEATVVLTAQDETAPVLTAASNQDVVLGENCSIIVPDVTGSATDNCAGTTITQLPAAGTVVTAIDGQTINVVVTAEDAAGNKDEATVVLTAQDETVPVLTAASNQDVVLGENCSIIVPDVTGSATDNCAGTTITQLPAAGTVVTAIDGQTINVVVTAEDAAGNKDEATVVLTAQDETAPVLTAASNQDVVLGENCSIIVPDVTGSATDNCAGTTITQLPAAGTVVTAIDGQTINVVVTAEDAAGNKDEATVVLTAQDETAPVLTAASNQDVFLGENCSIIVPDVTGSATDNCAGTTITQLPAAGTEVTAIDGQTINVVVTAEDAAGNTDEATVVLTAQDETAPVLTAASNQDVFLGENCSIIVPDVTGSATDNCAGTTITQLPAAGTEVTAIDGQTINVVVTAEDAAGNTDEATVVLTAQDETAPVLTAASNQDVVLGENCSIIVPDVTGSATDNCAGTTITQLPAAGTEVTAIDGQTINVVVTAEDAAGNKDEATVVLTAQDETAPVLTAASNQDVVLGENCSIIVPDVTGSATDNCAGTTITQLPAAGTEVTAIDGQTINVVVTAEDAAGNKDEATVVLTAQDETAPVLTAASNQDVVLGENCSIIVPDVTGSATDNCAGTTITQLPAAGTEVTAIDGQEIEVVVTAEDAAGNTDEATVVLTAQDETVPVLTAASNQDVVLGENCSIIVPDVTGSATDNCAGTTITQLPAAGTEVTAIDGQEIEVIVTAEDAAGNKDEATVVLTAQDEVDPTIACPADAERANNANTCTYTVVGTEFDPAFGDNCTGASINNNYNNASTLAGAVFEEGETEVVWTVIDAAGNKTTCSFTVTVANEAPVVDAISAPEHPVQAGSNFTLSANYTDNNIQNVTWIFSTGSEANGTYREWSINGSASGGKVMTSFSTSQFDVAGNKGAGVYSVKLVITDFCGVSAELVSERYVVIFDPTGGFVTGGGWIESPIGASKIYPLAVGRANFGFNAKYKTGKNNLTEVDGHTNFQFKAGDLHFSSFEHEDMSLVIAGKKATYTGYGTVNGSGVHRFRVIAIDGQANGGNGPDEFRIKIWGDGSNSEDDVLYDNMRGVAESSDLATTLGGGSIVIHKPKSSGKTAEVIEKVSVTASEEAIVEILESMAIAPNPLRDEARVRFSLIEDAAVVLRVFDFNGREVERLFSGNVRAHEVKEVSFQRRNLMSGVYILKLTTDRGNSYDKQIIVE